MIIIPLTFSYFKEVGVCSADGHEDINQLLGKELGIMDEEKLEKISEHIEIKGGRIVLKHQRKISSLLVLRTLRSLTQGGTTK